ncbi:MAG: hypothetical protein HY320_16565 [Armatimonadetes bacterium]|nr:hypothetical protein [Armatimonadota bacterium]
MAYSFHKGEKSRYRVEMGQDVHMDVGGGTENLPGPVPTAIHQAVTLDFLHTIRAVEANSAARVLAKVGDVSLVNDMGSQKLELSIQNGKVTQKMNGETSPSGSRDAEVMMKAVFQQSTELRLARNGKILSTSRSKSQQPGGLQDPLGIGGVMGSGTGGYGTLILPNRPVRVGDTWKDIQTLDLPAPSSADPRKMTKSRLTIRTDYRLKEVVERNGRRLALIESELVGSFGGDAGAGATRLQSVSLRSKGTTEFDIVGGFVAAGQYATEYKMASEMGAPMGGGGPRGPASMNMTATGTMKLSRL